MKLEKINTLLVTTHWVANKLFDRDKHRDKRENERLKTEDFNRKRKQANFEKGDTWALIVAALTTILPIALVTILAIWLITTAIFRFFA